MSVLQIGAGGVGWVIAHKLAQNNGAFGDGRQLDPDPFLELMPSIGLSWQVEELAVAEASAL